MFRSLQEGKLKRLTTPDHEMIVISFGTTNAYVAKLTDGAYVCNKSGSSKSGGEAKVVTVKDDTLQKEPELCVFVVRKSSTTFENAYDSTAILKTAKGVEVHSFAQSPMDDREQEVSLPAGSYKLHMTAAENKVWNSTSWTITRKSTDTRIQSCQLDWENAVDKNDGGLGYCLFSLSCD